jgi:hypothetical protein
MTRRGFYISSGWYWRNRRLDDRDTVALGGDGTFTILADRRDPVAPKRAGQGAR